MARRRKTEVKAPVKSSYKYVPVRKSSRQIAKKQLEEKKINGEIVQTSCSNSSEDSRSTNEEHNQVVSKSSQKKHRRHRGSTSSSNVIISDENAVYHASRYKRDAGESDSQDYIDNIINDSEKLSAEDVRQVVVGDENPSNESLNTPAPEMDVWSEDVIEETIICDEMEMEEDVAGNNYNLARDNVMLEQVLLVSEPNLEGKDFMEYTVIQNEDGTESMVVAPNLENISDNEYRVIRETVGSVGDSEAESSISVVRADESVTSGSENCSITNFKMDKPYVNKKKAVLEDQSSKRQKGGKTIYDKIRKEISESISDKIHMCSIKDCSGPTNESSGDNCKREGKDSRTKMKMHEDSSKEDTFCKIDSKLANMQINECSKEIQKLVNDLSSTEGIDSPVQTPLNIEKLSPVNIDDESSSSILDKMEQLHCPNNSVSSHVTDIFSKSIESNNVIKNLSQDTLKPNSCVDKMQHVDQVSSKSRAMQEKKYQQKSTENLGIINEYQDSEGDSKIDSEDIKCSSSENSNDTLLSLTNNKGRDLDVKNVIINNASDNEKKEFRSCSESTETIAFENVANSSGVRRSSRIRSIGLMKQRYEET